MPTTTKKDLIDRITDETGLRRNDVKRTVQAFLDHMTEDLGRGNRIEFRDFGVFETRDRAPRMAQNPRTLERVPVPARKTVRFKVGRLMRVALENDGGEVAATSTPTPRSLPARNGADARDAPETKGVKPVTTPGDRRETTVPAVGAAAR